MIMDSNRFNEVIIEYNNRYKATLNRIWPTIGDNGFNECNQTANFIAAYEKIASSHHEETCSWYEFQIQNGKKNDNRIDGLIINFTRKTIYLVESKRFSQNSVNRKLRELGSDIDRILELDVQSRFGKDFFHGGETIQDYSIYGVLLFDLWTYSQKHKREKYAFELWSQFCNNHDIDSLSNFLNLDSAIKNRLKNSNASFLSTIRDVKEFEGENSCIYHLNVLAFQK